MLNRINSNISYELTDINKQRQQKYELLKNETNLHRVTNYFFGALSGITLLGSFAYICTTKNTTEDHLKAAGAMLGMGGILSTLYLSKIAFDQAGLIMAKKEIDNQELALDTAKYKTDLYAAEKIHFKYASPLLSSFIENVTKT